MKKKHEHLRDGPNFLKVESVFGGKAKRKASLDEYERYRVSDDTSSIRTHDKKHAEEILGAGERVGAKRGFRALFGR